MGFKIKQWSIQLAPVTSSRFQGGHLMSVIWTPHNFRQVGSVFLLLHSVGGSWAQLKQSFSKLYEVTIPIQIKCFPPHSHQSLVLHMETTVSIYRSWDISFRICFQPLFLLGWTQFGPWRIKHWSPGKSGCLTWTPMAWTCHFASYTEILGTPNNYSFLNESLGSQS